MAEQALSEQSVYSARPTLRIDTQVNHKATGQLLSMEMTEQEGGMSSMELRFSNVASAADGGSDFAFEDDADLRLGARIAVYGGDEHAPQEIFQGTIMGIEVEFRNVSPPEILVFAEDVFQQARMTRRTRVHRDVTISDLANELAEGLSLTPVVTGFTESIGTRVQLNQSDLGFLRGVLERYDGDMQVVGDELHVSPRLDVQRGTVELEYPGQLREARVMADLAHQSTQVTVSGWDPGQGRAITADSSGTNLGPGSGRLGSQILASLFERNEHLGHPGVITQDEAQALAETCYDRNARRFVCVNGTAQGNPRVRVGTHVTLSGLGPRADNTYYVVRACHRYDKDQGYETDFEGECAYWGQP